MPGPTASLEELTTPLTRAEVQASIYDGLAALGVNTTSWKPGSVVRTMIVATSIVLAAFSKLQADIAKSGFLELSAGSWLRLVAWFVYGVKWDPATFATGAVTLTNSGGGIYGIDPDDLIFTNTVTGKTYRNTSAFTLNASDTITVPVQATELGSLGGALPGQITGLTTPLLGVTCTNALALVGRNDEPDPSLRARCSEKLGSLSPMGPWDAYFYAVRNAKRVDGSSVGITRIRITKDGAGNVYTYCATPSGAVPGTVGDLTTDLGIADKAIQQFAAPLGVTAHTLTATAVPIAITYEVWMYDTSGRTPLQVEAVIGTRLGVFMSLQPIGGNVISPAAGKVFVDAIRANIADAFSEIFHVVVTLPAGDTTLAVSEVPTLDATVPTAVHQVPPPEGFGA